MGRRKFGWSYRRRRSSGLGVRSTCIDTSHMLPTFPMRPSNGGPLPLVPNAMRYAGGDYAFEPKINGWRALLNCQTGEMWNRHGEKLSITSEFGQAIEALRALNAPRHRWLDVESMSRRHRFAKGALIVLDELDSNSAYTDRRQLLASHLPTFELDAPPLQPGGVYLIPSFSYPDALAFWNSAPLVNAVLECTYYEGVVAKLRSSPYDTQLRSDSEESTHWVKHRFTTQ